MNPPSGQPGTGDLQPGAPPPLPSLPPPAPPAQPGPAATAPPRAAVGSARRPPAPGRLGRWALLLGAVVIVAVAVFTVAAVRNPTPPARLTVTPLRVSEDLLVRATPPTGGCNTTFTFLATGSVDGVGTMVYRWEQSDGRNTPDLSLTIDNSIGAYALHRAWRIEGSQDLAGSMTFHVLKPTPRTASVRFSYSCS